MSEATLMALFVPATLSLVLLGAAIILYRVVVQMNLVLTRTKEMTELLFPDGLAVHNSEGFVKVNPDWNEELEGKS